MRIGAVLGVVVLALGCATRGVERGDVSDPLVPTLQIRVERDTVVFDLHVTNASGEPVTLEFSSGQRYDFVVRSEPGREEVWRWSADRMFTQALDEVTIPPGETARFEGAWPSRGRSGRYTAIGRVTSMNLPVEIAKEFELP